MTAVAWVGEPGDRRRIGRSALEGAIESLAKALVDAADVAIVMPPLPELVVGFVACGRRGIVPRLVHPLDELPSAHTILTSSAFVYHGELVPLKEAVDEAVRDGSVAQVVVHDRTGWMPLGPTLDVYHDVPMLDGRDVWFGRVDDAEEGLLRLVEAPSLRAIVEDPGCLVFPGPDETLLLYEGYLEADDEARARAAYVGASGTSRGSRPAGRLS